MKLEEMRTELMAIDKRIKEEMGVRSHKLPIYQTTTWEFDDPKQMEEAFTGHALLDVYGLFSSPNYRALEAKLALLEEGEAAQLCASGHMAIFAALMLLSKPGEVIVAHEELYGGTYPILNILQKEGHGVRFTDMRDADAIESSLCENTALLFFETPSNPSLHIIDIQKVAETAKRYKNDILVVIDNTFATPFNQRPLTLGADLVLQSLTKYLDGHGINFGGAVIASKDIIQRLYPILSFAPMAPYVAWQLSESVLDFLQTMPIHNKNAWKIAHFLARDSRVKRVHYPGLLQHKNHHVASVQMKAFDSFDYGIPYGGMISFELHGAKREAELFVEELRKQKSVITHAVSLGNRDSLIEIPSCGTHVKGKVPENLIRLSVGIESSARLIADIGNALAALFPSWI